ncbi:MAG: FHA domain-containing protein [Burkholderiales bacterium]|nr:FHA domain-containing protein [Burkholderiales bacterium]
MGKLVVSLDNVVIKEFQITKERTTLGRRPYNDIVIDNLAVSGEHAVLTAAQSDVFIKFLAEDAEDYEKTMILRPGAFGRAPGVVGTPASAAAPAAGPASIKVLNGGAAGREVLLTKVVTTVGKPGVQVASVTKRPGGYVLSHVEGSRRPSVNGQPVGEESISLKHGDIIDLAGTQMQFVQN